MFRKRFNLRKVVAIATCLAGVTMFSGCDKENDPNENNNGTGVPGTVMNFTATAGDKQVSLSWTVPSDDGGSAITGYEVTKDNWANKETKTASQLSHTYAGLINGTQYTFKVHAINAKGIGAESTQIITLTVNPLTYDEGVVINGVKWATRNVDAFGTFAPKPEDAGMFYQWNRKKAWSATGSVTDWDRSEPTGSTWEKANDPSPSGWHVPTLDEVKTLLDANKVSSEWTTINGVNGCKFTDKTTCNTLFLPAAGLRLNNDGTLSYVGLGGKYWSSTQRDSSRAYDWDFGNGGVDWGSLSRSYGFNVRPVAE